MGSMSNYSSLAEPFLTILVQEHCGSLLKSTIETSQSPGALGHPVPRKWCLVSLLIVISWWRPSWIGMASQMWTALVISMIPCHVVSRWNRCIPLRLPQISARRQWWICFLMLGPSWIPGRNHLRSHIRSHPQRLPTAVCSNPLLPGVEFLDLLPVKSRLRMLPHSLKFHSPCVVAFLLTRGAHGQDWFRVALLRTWAEKF